MMEFFQRVFVQPWDWAYSLSIYWPIIVEGALVSLALGLIGCFLVVRGLSLLGDALSHAVLPGIVIGFLIGGVLHSAWIFVGATAMGVAAATLIQWIHQNSRVKEDASIGIVFTSLFALGVLLINWFAHGSDLDPGCVLYGNIENFILYPPSKVWAAIGPMIAIAVVVVAGIVLFYRYLLTICFDPGLAVALGMPTVLIHYTFMTILSLTVVTSFEAVGAILVIALLVMPGATARLWTDRMHKMLLLSAVHGLVSTLLGYWISHPSLLDTSASASICLVGFGLFLLSWVFAPSGGIIPRWKHHKALTRKTALENLLKTLGELCLQHDTCHIDQSQLYAATGMLRREFQKALTAGLDDKLVQRDGDMLTLTANGKEISSRLMRAHRLWENYLQSEIGLQADHLHDPAEWVEHHLSQERIEQLEQLLDVEEDYYKQPHYHHRPHIT